MTGLSCGSSTSGGVGLRCCPAESRAAGLQKGSKHSPYVSTSFHAGLGGCRQQLWCTLQLDAGQSCRSLTFRECCIVM